MTTPSQSSEIVPTGASGSVKSELHPDFREGDIILRARDGTKFQMYSLILRLASSIFSAMFQISKLGAASQGLSSDGRTISHAGGDIQTIFLDDDCSELLVALQIMSGKQFDTLLVRKALSAS